MWSSFYFYFLSKDVMDIRPIKHKSSWPVRRSEILYLTLLTVTELHLQDFWPPNRSLGGNWMDIRQRGKAVKPLMVFIEGRVKLFSQKWVHKLSRPAGNMTPQHEIEGLSKVTLRAVCLLVYRLPEACSLCNCSKSNHHMLHSLISRTR